MAVGEVRSQQDSVLKAIDRFTHRFAGFRLRHAPVMTLLGLVFLMAGLPNLFTRLDVQPVGHGSIQWSLDELNQAAVELQTLQERLFRWQADLLSLCFVATVLFFVVAVWRTVRVRKPQPIVVTIATLVLGALSIPLISLLFAAALWLFHVATWVLHQFGRLIHWLHPALVVFGYVVIGVGVIGAVVGVVYFVSEMTWKARGLLVGGIALAFVVLQLAGHTLGALLAKLGPAVRWLAEHLGLVTGWFVSAIVIVIIAMVVLGLVVALFGQIGASLCNGLTSAWKAGSDQDAAMDLTAGAGVAWSLLLLAAAADESFAALFDQAWHATDVVGWMGSPIKGYEFLLWHPARDYLVGSFGGYNCLLDCAVLLIMLGIGGASFLAGKTDWRPGTRLALPVLMVVGVAVAVAVPLFLLMIWSQQEADQ